MMSTNEILKEEKLKGKSQMTMRKIKAAVVMLVCFITFCSLQKVSDLVKYATTKASDYTIKYEKEEEAINDQKVYRLYRNDIYYGDVDINQYSFTDDKGNTDYKFCYLMSLTEETVGFIFIAAIYAIVILIVINSQESPFNKLNTIYMRVISLLMLGYAIVPGLVKAIMGLVRFQHARGTFSLKFVYMILVAAGVVVIAQVFDYGVKIQEDNDSIV